jgi:hypothetical protein
MPAYPSGWLARQASGWQGAALVALGPARLPFGATCSLLMLPPPLLPLLVAYAAVQDMMTVTYLSNLLRAHVALAEKLGTAALPIM